MANNSDLSPESIAKFGSRAGVIAVAVLLLTVLTSSYTIVAPGYTGVIFNIWSGSLRTVGQGLAMRVPWITRVQSYPTAMRTYTMVMRSDEGSSTVDDSIDLPTKEGQHIRQDISVTYNTSEEKAAHVFRSFRGAPVEDIENTFIRRTIITVAQNAAGQMSLSEIISAKRGELQSTIEKNLEGEMSKMGFVLDKVNLGASHLPPAIENQMQQKMAAQQQAQ
ncbi:MAG: SPFH domain-containing protein, partial [Elusimicrobiota bacterium]